MFQYYNLDVRRKHVFKVNISSHVRHINIQIIEHIRHVRIIWWLLLVRFELNWKRHISSVQKFCLYLKCEIWIVFVFLSNGIFKMGLFLQFSHYSTPSWTILILRLFFNCAGGAPISSTIFQSFTFRTSRWLLD